MGLLVTAFDAAVARTPDIDHFCSARAWTEAAAAELMPPRELWCDALPTGFLAMATTQHVAGYTYLEPYEMMWALGSPLVGEQPSQLAVDAVEALRRRPGWRLALVPGLAGPLLEAFEAAVPPRWRLRTGAATVRQVADLAGGLDGYLARRSRDFRKHARRIGRVCGEAGVTVEAVAVDDAAAVEAVMTRVRAIETESWKGADGGGLVDAHFAGFYRHMLTRLAPAGAVRVLFARAADQDVAFILGAVFAGSYRGLQFSYRRAHAAWSLGSFLQLAQIARLGDEPAITRYDLGTDMPYKRRWADGAHTTELRAIVRG